MTDQGPDPTPARTGLRTVLLGGALAAAVLVGGVAVALGSGGATPTPVAASAPVAVPTAAVVGVSGATVPWDAPLRLTVADGTVTAATVTDPDGTTVAGRLSPSGWTSSRTLIPAAAYTASLTVRDAADALHVLPLTVRTSPAAEILTAALSPGDDAVVGVGRTVEVRLDRDVEDATARAAVVSRLLVTAKPAVPGAWRWMDDRTVHYRPAQFWEPGTVVDVKVDLHRLSLPDGTWGSGVRTTRFRVGDAIVSTVDVQAHTMTVRRNGTVLRVLPASMGKPEFATRNGTFVVLEKHRRRIMDSATVNLPPGTPAYRTAVEHAVRITNSGTFTHGAPWSVRDQGVRNVSHGCINLSPSDAAWFFEQAKRGDVVVVKGSSREANSYDAGSRDWKLSFAEWQKA
ncbi:MAG: lppS [Frankiales bacterium]|nr:lppS [Frankiales bacterium]